MLSSLLPGAAFKPLPKVKAPGDDPWAVHFLRPVCCLSTRAAVSNSKFQSRTFPGRSLSDRYAKAGAERPEAHESTDDTG